MSLAIAAIIYLGISFAFSSESSVNAYIAWYVVAIFEVGSNIAIAGNWRILSFKDTHLVERMTCLTLIVLGEGVIGLTSRIALIENFDFIFSASGIGTIIASLLIIYFVYQLYFDNVQMEHFGTIRQQIWAFLHFPFHLALVLLMEGINQFVIWRHAVEILDIVFGPILDLSDNVTPDQFFDTLNQTVYDTLGTFWPPSNDTSVIDEILTALNTISPTSNATEGQFVDAAETITVELFKIVVEDFGFSPPGGDVSGLGFDDQINAYYSVFTLIFGLYTNSPLSLRSLTLLQVISSSVPASS